MKIITQTLLLAFVLLLTSCVIFASQTEVRQVKTFKSLDISGLAEVFITQADTQDIVVKVSGMQISDVITSVKDGTLFISTKGFHRGESVKVYVTYIHLENINISGSAELTGSNTLNADSLFITTGAAGDIKSLKIAAETLSISINGAGNADLDVDVESIDILMSDAGDLLVKGTAKSQKIRSNKSHGTLNNTDLDYAKH